MLWFCFRFFSCVCFLFSGLSWKKDLNLWDCLIKERLNSKEIIRSSLKMSLWAQANCYGHFSLFVILLIALLIRLSWFLLFSLHYYQIWTFQMFIFIICFWKNCSKLNLCNRKKQFPFPQCSWWYLHGSNVEVRRGCQCSCQWSGVFAVISLIFGSPFPCFLISSLRSNAGSDNQVRLQAEILVCVWRQYSIWLHLPSECPDSKVRNQYALMLYFSDNTSYSLQPFFFVFQWRDGL